MAELSVRDNEILSIQVSIFSFLPRYWNKNLDEIIEMDEQYGLLEIIKAGYETFHVRGDCGIANELAKIIGRSDLVV